MHVIATITREGDRFVATCAESPVVGDGKTRAEALRSLRDGLAETLQPEAIAPPSGARGPSIEITIADDDPSYPPERDGPGEA